MSDAPATLGASRQNQCHSRKIMSSPSGPQQRPYLPINSSSHNQQPQHLIVHHRAVNPEVSFSFQTSDGQSQQHINYQPNDQSSNAELMSMQQYNKRQTQYQDPYYQELELSNQRQQQQQQQEQKVSDGWNGSGQVEAQYHLQPSQHNRISSSDTLYQCSSASPFDYPGTVESSKSATHDGMSDFNNNDGQQNLTTNYSLGTQYIITEQQLPSDHKSAISSEVINYYSPLDSSNYDQQHYQSETATNYVNVQNNYCQSQQANGNNYDAHLNLHHHQHQQEQYHQESYNYLENTTLIEIQAQSAKPYKLHDGDLGFDDNILFTSTQEAVHSDEQAFQDTINSEVQQAQTTTSDKYSFTQVAIESHLDSVLSDSDKTRTVLRGRRGRPRKKSLKSKKSDKVNGKLWEFIRDLLLNERTNPSFIRWERREDGVFKFVQSDKVAKMWGERKQNPKMTYEKLSRAMRYYYKSKVLLPVFGRRLVYKFGPNATGWLPEKAEV